MATIVKPSTTKHALDIGYLAMEFAKTPGLGLELDPDAFASYVLQQTSYLATLSRLAYVDQQPAGFVFATFHSVYSELWVEAIYVKEGFRGRGIGRELVADLEPDMLASPAACVMFRSMTLSQKMRLRLAGIKLETHKIYRISREQYNHYKGSSNAADK